MYGDPSSLWHLTANPGVAAPFDPYPVIEEVVRAYDVRLVLITLREDATTDPLGLWDGCAATDSEGNPATWLGCEPVFEADGAAIRVFDARASGSMQSIDRCSALAWPSVSAHWSVSCRLSRGP